MKTFVAYDVNPRLLYKRLKESGQPLVGIRFDGPATRTVPYAVASFEDHADDAAIEAIVTPLSGPRPSIAKLNGPNPKTINNLDARLLALTKRLEATERPQ